MIEINEKTFIIGVWQLGFRGGPDHRPGNWLAFLSVPEPGANISLVYRFRYYEDDKIFDSEDERSWYKAEISSKVPHLEVIDKVRQLAAQLQAALPGSSNLNERLINGGMDALMTANIPWMHLGGPAMAPMADA